MGDVRSIMSGYIMDMRKVVGHRTIMQIAASVIVEDECGRILLQKRTNNHCWAYAGGAVEIDEVVESAARRELFEETGLVAEKLELFGIYSGKDMHYIYPNGDEVSNVDIVYICRQYTGELRCQEEEVSELRFFEASDVPDNISPPIIKAINDWKNMKERRDMNEVINSIMERRSIKAYKPDEVSKEIIERIVKAGTMAPTGMNKQSPIILAVTNKDMRDRIAVINARVAGVEGKDMFYGAPVVLVVLAKKDVATHIYDGSLVMANLMLAASSEGLGSCWIHRAKETFESKEGKEILRSLGIEDEYEGIGNCIIGYGLGDKPAVKDRKPDYVYYID